MDHIATLRRAPVKLMKVFQALALIVMGAFFVWLLLQMSRTWQADRRLAMMALAYLGVVAALGLGMLLGRSGRS